MAKMGNIMSNLSLTYTAEPEQIANQNFHSNDKQLLYTQIFEKKVLYISF